MYTKVLFLIMVLATSTTANAEQWHYSVSKVDNTETHYGKLAPVAGYRKQLVIRCKNKGPVLAAFPIERHRTTRPSIGYTLTFENGTSLRGTDFLKKSDLFVDIATGRMEKGFLAEILRNDSFQLQLDFGAAVATYRFQYHSSDAQYSLANMIRRCESSPK